MATVWAAWIPAFKNKITPGVFKITQLTVQQHWSHFWETQDLAFRIRAFILPKDSQGQMCYQNSHRSRNGMIPKTYSKRIQRIQPYKVDPDGNWVSHPLFKGSSLNRKSWQLDNFMGIINQFWIFQLKPKKSRGSKATSPTKNFVSLWLLA